MVNLIPSIVLVSVLQEFIVKKYDRVELVSMIGVYGFLVSLCEMYPFICYRLLL